MNGHRIKALIASADSRWQDACANEFASHGCDVHIVSRGFDALDLLRRHRYDIIAVDDSCPDMNAIELSLNATDLASNKPLTLVGDETTTSKHASIRRVCTPFFIGSKQLVPARIHEAVHRASVSATMSESVSKPSTLTKETR